MLSAIPKTVDFTGLDRSSSLGEMIEEVSNNLIDYFSILRTNFDNNICCALSAGFDTRLLLSVMRKVGTANNNLLTI